MGTNSSMLTVAISHFHTIGVKVFGGPRMMRAGAGDRMPTQTGGLDRPSNRRRDSESRNEAAQVNLLGTRRSPPLGRILPDRARAPQNRQPTALTSMAQGSRDGPPIPRRPIAKSPEPHKVRERRRLLAAMLARRNG